MTNRTNVFSKLFAICLVIMSFSSMALAEDATSNSANSQVNIVVGGLFLLVFMKFLIAGIIGYLWYRHSKFKKEKIILDI